MISSRERIHSVVHLSRRFGPCERGSRVGSSTGVGSCRGRIPHWVRLLEELRDWTRAPWRARKRRTIPGRVGRVGRAIHRRCRWRDPASARRQKRRVHLRGRRPRHLACLRKRMVRPGRGVVARMGGVRVHRWSYWWISGWGRGVASGIPSVIRRYALM